VNKCEREREREREKERLTNLTCLLTITPTACGVTLNTRPVLP